METQTILRSQADLLALVKAFMRDPNAARWTDPEIYAALNQALDTWQGRVSVPAVYSVPGGWPAQQFAYTLPTYVRPPFEPQREQPVIAFLPGGATTAETTWVRVPGYRTEPNAAGGLTLRLLTPPMGGAGRIVWRIRNGPLPTTAPTLAAQAAADATTLTLAAAVDVADAGYVKLDAEWVQYAGVERGATTTTLSGLVRGLRATAAAAHSQGATCYWGVAVHRRDLYNQLLDQVRAYLHEFYLTNAASQEEGRHERLLSFYQSRADAFWRNYKPSYAAQLILEH